MYRDYLKSLRKTQPQIHVLTNTVTSAFVADVLLAVACRPVMAFDAREVAEITAVSQALCINTGTPHEGIIPSYSLALKSAAEHCVPVVLDFPGVGASALRGDIADSLLNILNSDNSNWSRLIRGNGSEILALAGHEVGVSGIDSRHAPELALDAAHRLLSCVDAVCISGRDNHIVGRSDQQVAGGSSLMARGTGFGCISTALMAAFLNVDGIAGNRAEDAAAAVCYLMHQAAEMIVPGSGPSTFKSTFIDALYRMSESVAEE